MRTLFVCVCRRGDLSESLAKLKCRTLVIVGENSPFHCESVHITNVMSRRYQVLIEVIIHLCSQCMGPNRHALSIVWQTGDSTRPTG